MQHGSELYGFRGESLVLDCWVLEDCYRRDKQENYQCISKAVQQTKASATFRNFILQTYMVEGENWLLQVVFWSFHMCHPPPHNLKYNVKKNY